MKKILAIFVFLFALHVQLSAQIDTVKILNKADKSAIEMSDAYIAGNYERFMDFMHPTLIDLMGGRDTLKSLFTKSASQGVKVIKTDVEKPEKIIVKDTIIQCVLMQKQETRMFGGNYITRGSLIGISYNSGVDWYFINVAGNKISDLQKYFPELSNELEVIPQEGPAVKSN
jgi:hypothetical protein